MVPLSEIELRTSRSSGPGGQHANVTASRVEASFDVEASATLGEEEKRRIESRAGRVVRASAQDTRSQARNRDLALGACARSSSPRSRSSARGGPPSPPPPRGTGAWSRRSDAARRSAPAGARQATSTRAIGLGRFGRDRAAALAALRGGRRGRGRGRRGGHVGPAARGPGAVVRDRRSDRGLRGLRLRVGGLRAGVGAGRPAEVVRRGLDAQVRRVAARLVVAPAADCGRRSGRSAVLRPRHRPRRRCDGAGRWPPGQAAAAAAGHPRSPSRDRVGVWADPPRRAKVSA